MMEEERKEQAHVWLRSFANYQIDLSIFEDTCGRIFVNETDKERFLGVRLQLLSFLDMFLRTEK